MSLEWKVGFNSFLRGPCIPLFIIHSSVYARWLQLDSKQTSPLASPRLGSAPCFRHGTKACRDRLYIPWPSSISRATSRGTSTCSHRATSLDILPSRGWHNTPRYTGRTFGAQSSVDIGPQLCWLNSPFRPLLFSLCLPLSF